MLLVLDKASWQLSRSMRELIICSGSFLGFGPIHVHAKFSEKRREERKKRKRKERRGKGKKKKGGSSNCKAKEHLIVLSYGWCLA